MTQFQYFAVTPGLNGKPYGFCFEHPAANLDDLADEIAENGLAAVDKLMTVDDSKGGRLIQRRERVIIGQNSIGTISYPHLPHWEASAHVAA